MAAPFLKVRTLFGVTFLKVTIKITYNFDGNFSKVSSPKAKKGSQGNISWDDYAFRAAVLHRFENSNCTVNPDNSPHLISASFSAR